MKYNKKVMRYFLKPKNIGEIKNPDGRGQVGNMACGDVMKLTIKIGKKKVKGKNIEFIKDVKFKTFGCAAAIATSSVVTELVKGETLEKALKIKNKEIIRFLGGLPPVKHHCSLLAEDALAEAIYDYLKKKKRKIPKQLLSRHQKIKKAEKAFQCKFGK